MIIYKPFKTDLLWATSRAVKFINRIQNKSWCLHNMCVCLLCILICIYKYTHAYMSFCLISKYFFPPSNQSLWCCDSPCEPHGSLQSPHMTCRGTNEYQIHKLIICPCDLLICSYVLLISSLVLVTSCHTVLIHSLFLI